jgi:hypothetical protein
MFIHRRRRGRWVLVAVAVVVVAGAAWGALRLFRHPSVRVTGTLTTIAPLACSKADTTRFGQDVVVFEDPKGRELARAVASLDVHTETEHVRGFAHCRMAASYSVRLPKADAYTVVLPDRQLTLATVTYQQLEAKGFRYDITF